MSKLTIPLKASSLPAHLGLSILADLDGEDEKRICEEAMRLCLMLKVHPDLNLQITINKQ